MKELTKRDNHYLTEVSRLLLQHGLIRKLGLENNLQVVSKFCDNFINDSNTYLAFAVTLAKLHGKDWDYNLRTSRFEYERDIIRTCSHKLNPKYIITFMFTFFEGVAYDDIYALDAFIDPIVEMYGDSIKDRDSDIDIDNFFGCSETVNNIFNALLSMNDVFGAMRRIVNVQNFMEFIADMATNFNKGPKAVDIWGKRMENAVYNGYRYTDVIYFPSNCTSPIITQCNHTVSDLCDFNEDKLPYDSLRALIARMVVVDEAMERYEALDEEKKKSIELYDIDGYLDSIWNVVSSVDNAEIDYHYDILPELIKSVATSSNPMVVLHKKLDDVTEYAVAHAMDDIL